MRQDLAETLEESRQFVAVYLNPTSAQELQSVRSGEQGADLGGGQPFFAECQLDAEVQESVLA